MIPFLYKFFRIAPSLHGLNLLLTLSMVSANFSIAHLIRMVLDKTLFLGWFILYFLMLSAVVIASTALMIRLRGIIQKKILQTLSTELMELRFCLEGKILTIVNNDIPTIANCASELWRTLFPGIIGLVCLTIFLSMFTPGWLVIILILLMCLVLFIPIYAKLLASSLYQYAQKQKDILNHYVQEYIDHWGFLQGMGLNGSAKETIYKQYRYSARATIFSELVNMSFYAISFSLYIIPTLFFSIASHYQWIDLPISGFFSSLWVIQMLWILTVGIPTAFALLIKASTSYKRLLDTLVDTSQKISINMDVLMRLHPQSHHFVLYGYEGAWKIEPSVALASLMSSIIDGTIAENIALTLSYDPDRVRHALHEACITLEELSLPSINGYINEEALSMGQKSRIFLARLFYHARTVNVIDQIISTVNAECAECILRNILKKDGRWFVLENKRIPLISLSQFQVIEQLE